MHAFSLAVDLLHSKHHQHRITAEILYAAYADRTDIPEFATLRIGGFVIDISTFSYTLTRSDIRTPS
jgi:hypothetical protein